MNRQSTVSGKPRQRAAVACNLCRVKRIKCDGNRPSCTSCSQANEACEYSAKESNRKPPSKRYVEALKERIRNLELQLEQFRPVVRAGEFSEEEQSPESSGDSELEATPEGVLLDRRSPMRELSDRLGRLNVGEDGQVRYFGARSNFSLLRNKLTKTSSISTPDLETQTMTTLQRLNLRVEISDELRDHLLAIFWSWQNTWQYIVIEELFMNDLLVEHTNRYASPLVLSAMLSLAARYSDRPELRTDPNDPNTAGDALAEQAKMILYYESQAPKVTTVQGAALLSLREIATDKEALGWVYCGMATRMAFNLGLHINCDRWCKQGHITQEQAEFRNVVWWACYVLDKLFNVGLGRPCTIQEHEVSATLPSPQQGPEFGAWVAVQDSGAPIVLVNRHVISNVQATCELFEITASVLDDIYRPRANRTKLRVEDLVAKTHVKLMEFYTNLPSCLRLPVSFTQPALPHVYQLHLQYHVAVILLHRPFICIRGHGENSSSGVAPDVNTVHLKQCSQSAQSIANVFKAYRKHYTLRRIPISAVHCAFTASIIVLVEATSPDLTDSRRTTNSLEILVTALNEMSTAWTWSRRALSAIQQLAKEWAASDKIRDLINERIPQEGKSKESTPSKPDAGTQWAFNSDLSWIFGDINNMEPVLPFATWDGFDQWGGTGINSNIAGNTLLPNDETGQYCIIDM